jgi:dTDP-4-dehydrorhamnose 3,5-epimerase
VVAYKVDDFYASSCDSGLVWNDPDLAIDWPVTSGEVVLSDKDLRLGRFADFASPFTYQGP